MAGKVLEKLKSEVEEKGLKLSISERGKEGKSKVPCTSANCPRISFVVGEAASWKDNSRLNCKLLIACGRRAFLISVYFVVMATDGVHANVVSTLSSYCQGGEKFKHARTNGKSNHDGCSDC